MKKWKVKEEMFKFLESEKFYLPIIFIAVGVLVYLVISKMITSISKIDIKHSKGLDKRKNTVVVLIKNIIKYTIAIIVIIMILNVYGVNTTSLIASLGAATVIVGLAFQDIIKDFLAGVFLVFDNAYAVGDIVEINGFKGEVVSLGLKTTKIKAFTGEVKILSNSSFTEVINYNLNHSKMVISIPVHYRTNVEELEKVLTDIKKEIEKEKDVYSMELLGIDDFADSCMKYAILLDCACLMHYGVKRKVLRMIKISFDQVGIEIPYNKLDVHIEK